MEILHHNVKQFPLFKQPLSRLLVNICRVEVAVGCGGHGAGRGPEAVLGLGQPGQGTSGAGDTGQWLGLAQPRAPRAEGFDYLHMCRAAGL